ncbi:MAG: LysM peptidoglycan-binding domain-containing protein [Firmicutes bacterium]|uniref:Peptidoglycan endopeptidase n=1 Tax=Sulfobacillus benefaciens TaxID=453960 RepID=A0A2T2WSW7_9FIRM|nr:LysM peptidoglycan-binding domain-containing protein [Bacillota bacterium]MCL5012467.1 LysM peptidoglycan-binding domain-containing protein [Bacillota bacterium]PSR25345.1 MAG: peptidoglycan endopeptidase [Sulfobacillus benefaciens]HBQ94534.1 peptidoglycan endopeptidase [Sulfobacillus sp.]
MNRLLSKKVTAGLAVSLLSMPAAMSLLSVSAPSHSVLASTVASVSPHYLSSRSYTVQPGDTLGSIAYRFHTTVAILAAINHIANPNTIYIGQILHISTAASSGLRSQSSSSSPSFETAHSTTYTVHPGDTLSAIASRFHVTVAQLVQWNHIANPNIISVGQVLVIGASTASSSSSDSSSSTSSTSSSARKYTVQSGDTLSLIAQKFGISWQTLASFNHLSNPNVLQVGEVLEIPGKQAASSTSAQLPAQSASVGFGQAIVNTAEHLLGIPYVWGGASPSTGFDCSGLVQYVFRQNGIPMPRTSWAQYAYVTKIAKSQLQPGDLVFFQTDGPGASHVGIYIGAAPQLGYSQAFIEAPQPGQSVQISNLNDPFYVDHYYGAGTVNP